MTSQRQSLRAGMRRAADMARLLYFPPATAGTVLAAGGDSPEPSGESVIAPVRETEVSGTGRTGGWVENLAGGNAGGFKLQARSESDIGVHVGPAANDCRFREVPGNVFTHDIAARPDAGPEVDIGIRGGRSGGFECRAQDGAGHSFHRAAPSGVGDSDDAAAAQGKGETIGTTDGNRESRFPGQQRVGFGVEPSRRGFAYARAMDLPRGREPLGVYPKGGQNAPPVLGHRAGCIGGGSPEIQIVIGCQADAPAACRHGDDATRGGEGGAPHHYMLGRFEDPGHVGRLFSTTFEGQGREHIHTRSPGVRSSLSRIWVALLVLGFTLGGAPARVLGAPGTIVATVGSSGIRQDELDARAAEMEVAYRGRMGADLNAQQRASIRRQALETLVRQRLYVLGAGRAQVSDAEVEAYLKHMPIFNPNGQFSQRAWDNAHRNDPASFKRAADEARRELGAQRLSENLRKKYTPSDDALRRAATRTLESANLNYLALPMASFTGRAREPSEKEVLEEYRAHMHDFDRPAEATVHALLFETDAPDNAALATMKQKALSAITGIQGGTALSDVGDQLGGRQRRITLRDDNLPGSWRATPAQNARIFSAPPGTLIPEPVPGAQGFYVVEVDTSAARRPGTLAEASPIVRAQLRTELSAGTEQVELKRFYASVRDSLGRPGYRLRCAVVDAAKLKVPEPSQDDLKSFYQSRLADYSRFDPVSQSLTARPFAEVRGELNDRWRSSRRDLFARDLANRIEDAWSQDRRDRTLEAQATLYELGAVPYGGTLDLGGASKVVSDTLNNRIYGRTLEVVPFAAGYAVVHAYELVERLVPSLDQVRAQLLDRMRAAQETAEVEEARKIYERNPYQYLTGKLVYYSRLWCPQPELIDVPLSRQEVESYYRQHLADYGSPERFRLRHILFKLSGGEAASQQQARARAADALKRIRAGENFQELARRLSDDDKTRDDGGDLGYRSAGELVPEIQKVGFALKLGQVSDPVLATDGYHLLKLEEHVAEVTEPLAWVYTAVGADAAIKKSQTLARQFADSLAQVIRNPAQGRAVADKLGLQVEQYRHRPGDRGYPENLIPMAERLDRMKPGEIYPGSEYFLGQGAAAMWVDSIASPRIQDWAFAQTPVLIEYRRRLSAHALAAKQAEMDSLMRAGWTFESLGELWGGLAGDNHYVRRKALGKLGASDLVDSVVFGLPGTPGLAAGSLSGWVPLSDFSARLRVNRHGTPSAAEVEQQMGPIRGLEIEYGLRDELKELKRQFPVRIVDPVLREVSLPPLPPRPEL